MDDLRVFEPYAGTLALWFKQVDPGNGDRQDIWQEAMIAAWVALGKWDGRGDRTEYVKLQMKRRVIEYVRKRSNGRIVEDVSMVPFDEWDEHGHDLTLERVLERERLQNVITVMRGLSRWQRTRMVNRIEGLSNVEIARAEGCTVTAIDRSFWKTRKAIKLALAA